MPQHVPDAFRHRAPVAAADEAARAEPVIRDCVARTGAIGLDRGQQVDRGGDAAGRGHASRSGREARSLSSVTSVGSPYSTGTLLLFTQNTWKP